MVAMDVSDLAFADGVFHAAEAVRTGGRTFPVCHFISGYSASCSVYISDITLHRGRNEVTIASFLPESAQVGTLYDSPSYPYVDDKLTYVWDLDR